MKRTPLFFLMVLSHCFCFGALCPKADLNKDCFVDLADFAILASEWLTGNQIIEPNDIVWIAIDDPGYDNNDDGVADYENFNGEMSRYETTNGQYCIYLNEALSAGEIVIREGVVYDSIRNGPEYIKTYPTDSTSLLVYTEGKLGGTFSVRDHDGYSMTGHPVQVTWDGAEAFCAHYGVRLPTYYEWIAVADYDGSYTYGCGTEINEDLANYNGNNPIGFTVVPFTTPVGYFGPFGYDICDTAGNVKEWTRTGSYAAGYYPEAYSYMTCGGDALLSELHCEIVTNNSANTDKYRGFRVCRGNERAVPDAVGHMGVSARAAIQSRYLNCKVIHAFGSGTPGFVTAQTPAAGTMAVPGDLVEITVNMGPMPGITWVAISNADFDGQMSKFEITHEQYCNYLNSAIHTGDIIYENGEIRGADGVNAGSDYPNSKYYETWHVWQTRGIAKQVGGDFYVRTRDGIDLSNHPLYGISLAGAQAYCHYYGYRLPSLSEWNSVANYDGNYVYGCGNSISASRANYNSNNPLGFSEEPFTTPVGHYSAYGYGMCDMAGNVEEWISTSIVKGGYYGSSASDCLWISYNSPPSGYSGYTVGFRPCK